MISTRQNLRGGAGETAARLRLMRFLSKRFTAGVFRNTHQSQRLRARTLLNSPFGDGASQREGSGSGSGSVHAGGRTLSRSSFSRCVL